MTPAPLHAAENPEVHAAFSRRFLPGIACLLAAALFAAAFAVLQLARSIDRDALLQESFLATKALAAPLKGMAQHVADNGFWGDAYANLSKRVNLDWAYEQSNLGSSLFEDFGYDAVLVVDAEGETTYAVVRGELVQLDARQWIGNGFDELIAQAREAVEQEETASGVITAGGQPAMVAAAVMTPGGSDIEEMEGPASVLLFVDLLEPARLLELGQQYAIDGLRLAKADAGAKEVSVSLDLLDGTSRQVTWDLSQPGRLLLWTTLPVLGAVALGLAILAWLLLRQALRMLRLVDESYRRLAISREALADSEARFRDVAEAASDWIWETDANARLTYLSSRFGEITGHSPADWIGRPLIDLLISDQAALQDWLAAPQRAPLRCSYRAANSCERNCRLSARAIHQDGQRLGYRGTASDITDETRAQAQIHYLSQHDALTGLPNRNRLREHLDGKLSTLGNGSRLAVLYIDLDRFKPVNDTFGHGAGDEVLTGVSTRLTQCVRGDDLVARLGGDEFVIVMSRVQRNEDLEKLCQRIVAAINEPFTYEHNQIFIGASVGVAMAPADAMQANELLRCADIALYQAKAAGRGTWRFYGREMDQRLLERHALEDELRQAIAEEQFEIHYQPRYLSEGMRINGAEALLRWRHPQRGLLLPEHFIPLAEETGLIVPLGSWVLRQACFEAAGWSREISVSINLSPLQLRSDDLCDTVRTALSESALPSGNLELEITETALLQENQRTLDVLNALKALGVRLAMDDFGTGYSSLSNLRTYPFDTIKIDGSFVSGMEHSTADHSIVKALIELGNGLHMRVTAEGVETPAQLERLVVDGCGEIQGFHMSHPLPAADMRSLLATSCNWLPDTQNPT